MAAFLKLLLLHCVVAADAAAPPIANGDFEDNLRGWDVHCTLERCAEATTESDSDAGAGRGSVPGKHAASLRGSADEWNAVGLRQRLATDYIGEPIVAEASFRGSPSSAAATHAPLELRLLVAYEDASGAPLGHCAEERNELPSEWTRLRVRCAPPTPAAGGAPAARVLVAVEFACVRGAAALLVDNVGVALESAAGPGAAAPAAALAPASVPRIVHFIFGLAADFGGKPFGLVHHLVVKAALQSVAPTTAYFHYAHAPSGAWWDKTKPLLTLRHVTPPKSIFGNPVRRFAHQADVLRLELLLQFGGVYMDLDVLLVKPLPPQLLRAPEGIVLAHEGIDGTIGAGNAFMLVRRNHSLMAEWYGRYRKFSDGIWNGFSVRLPMEMAIAHPGSVKLLNYTALYWPPWNPWGVAQLYRAPRCLRPDSYGVHLWETKMWASLLSKLQPEIVHKRDTCFARMASAVLDGTFDFAPATLPPEEPAETADAVLREADLAKLLGDAGRGSAATEAPRGRPPELARFRTGWVAGASADAADADCVDAHADCGAWQAAGECAKNHEFMMDKCRRACKAC